MKIFLPLQHHQLPEINNCFGSGTDAEAPPTKKRGCWSTGKNPALDTMVPALVLNADYATLKLSACWFIIQTEFWIKHVDPEQD
jgi:hypothetical protein